MKIEVNSVFASVFFTISLLVSPSTPCQSRSSYNRAPVLEMKPRSADGGSLIWYTPYKPVDYWKKELDEFLKPYFRENKPETVESCGGGYPPSKGKVCDFQIRQDFQPCLPQNNYGFGNTMYGPCIFLRLSKVPGWTPRFYNSTNLPTDMPVYLKESIRRSANTGLGHQVWVDCVGEYPADIENLGPVQYFPSRGFPGHYFPYNSVDAYLSPLVAVLFENPLRGVVISVVCTAWAANIPRDKDNHLGTIHFEILKE